jgi:hypothetical protein
VKHRRHITTGSRITKMIGDHNLFYRALFSCVVEDAIFLFYFVMMTCTDTQIIDFRFHVSYMISIEMDVFSIAHGRLWARFYGSASSCLHGRVWLSCKWQRIIVHIISFWLMAYARTILPCPPSNSLSRLTTTLRDQIVGEHIMYASTGSWLNLGLVRLVVDNLWIMRFAIIAQIKSWVTNVSFKPKS